MLNYNYDASKAYCEQIGLIWIGEPLLISADADAKTYGFTQEQVDVAMRHHLWQVKFLFQPNTYSYKQRILLALHFLFGRNK